MDIAESKVEEGRLENGLFLKQGVSWVTVKEDRTAEFSLVYHWRGVPGFPAYLGIIVLPAVSL